MLVSLNCPGYNNTKENAWLGQVLVPLLRALWKKCEEKRNIPSLLIPQTPKQKPHGLISSLNSCAIRHRKKIRELQEHCRNLVPFFLIVQEVKYYENQIHKVEDEQRELPLEHQSSPDQKDLESEIMPETRQLCLALKAISANKGTKYCFLNISKPFKSKDIKDLQQEFEEKMQYLQQ